MEIRELSYKKQVKKDIFINFIISLSIIFIFLIYSEFIGLKFSIINISLSLLSLIILLIIYHLIFNKKNIYKNNLIEIFSIFYFSIFYVYILYISHSIYNPFFMIILILFAKNLFFENNTQIIYLYTIFYLILSIVLLKNYTLTNIFIEVTLFYILFFIFITKLKISSSEIEDNIYNINIQNSSYQNQSLSNLNFINQILFDLDYYLTNLISKPEYKKNIIIIRNIQKKIKENIYIKNQNIEIDIEVFSIDKILSEILEEYSPLLLNKNIKIFFKKFTNIDYNLNSDKNKVKEVLSEIIENAINFSYNDSTITITEEKISDRIIIKVENYSENIINNRIFELNYSYGKNSSIGLGLYIAKKYADTTKTSIDIKRNRETQVILANIELKMII